MTMKLIRSSVSGLVACSLMLATVTTLTAQTADQGTAKVVNIRGSARYMTAENPSWRPLKTGTLLKPGSTVQTATDSYVDIVLNNPKATASASAALTAASSSSPITTAAYSKPRAEQDAVRIFENTVLGIDRCG
jgi:hypothetical protein